MIRHHDKCIQKIAFFIKVSQGICHDLRAISSPQCTIPVSGIKPLMNDGSEATMVFVPEFFRQRLHLLVGFQSVSVQPGFLFRVKLLQLCLRQ